MKTQVMTFNISNTFEEWVETFDSHREMQAAAGMTPLFRGPQENDPQKVCVVIQVEDDAKVAAFMAENEASILELGRIPHTTESNTYLWSTHSLNGSVPEYRLGHYCRSIWLGKLF